MSKETKRLAEIAEEMQTTKVALESLGNLLHTIQNLCTVSINAVEELAKALEDVIND